MSLRMYVTGTVQLVEDDAEGRTARLVDERTLPGKQGRLVLAMLAIEHRRPVARDELAEEMWPEGLPHAWEVGLRSIVSKIRASLSVFDSKLIEAASGAYRWIMPRCAWLDIDEAFAAVHRGESALRSGDLGPAAGDGLAAAVIAARPFLQGIDGPWVERQRARLVDVRVRGLDVTSEVWLRTGDPAESARDGRTILEMDPYHEPALRRIMRAELALGNRAGAAEAFEAYRQRLLDELGVEPSDATLGLRDELLGSAPRPRGHHGHATE